MWLRGEKFTLGFSIYDHDHEKEEAEGTRRNLEVGSDFILSIASGSSPLLNINFSLLTEAELDAFRQFMDMAMYSARDTVLERDRVAKDELEKGNDSYSRSYRQLPTFLIRERALGPHHPGLLERLKDIFPGGLHGGDRYAERTGDDQYGGARRDLRADSSTMADRSSEATGGQDDPTKTDGDS